MEENMTRFDQPATYRQYRQQIWPWLHTVGALIWIDIKESTCPPCNWNDMDWPRGLKSKGEFRFEKCFCCASWTGITHTECLHPFNTARSTALAVTVKRRRKEGKKE